MGEIVFSILQLLGVVEYLGKKSAVSREKMQELKDYVRVYLQHEKPKSLIRKNLIDAGWSAKVVDEVLSDFNENHYRKCHSSKSFYTNGKHLSSLRALLKELHEMEDHHFLRHATTENNDFSNWIHHVYDDPTLAIKIKGKDKDETIRILHNTLFK